MKYVVTTIGIEGYEDNIFKDRSDAEDFKNYADCSDDYSYVGDVENF